MTDLTIILAAGFIAFGLFSIGDGLRELARAYRDGYEEESNEEDKGGFKLHIEAEK